MATKKDRPTIENPLANMGLDEIVRGMTTTEQTSVKEPVKKKVSKRKATGLLEENLSKFTGISEQGVAIWLPKEVKKRLEIIRLNASRNIPIRALAAAIIMTYIEENESKLEEI